MREGSEYMKYVLFVCNHDAGRSQMAQAFFERHGPDDVRAESAGSAPGAQLWPEVVKAEVGIDLAGRKQQEAAAEDAAARRLGGDDGCGDACPYVPTTVEDWDLPDPAGRSLEDIRAIRDGHRDARARPRRPEARRHPKRQDCPSAAPGPLLPGLAENFEGRRSAGEIRACADAILAASTTPRSART
jgi:protein-tyrosine-phosphatase